MSHHSGLRSGGVHNWCCPWIYSTTVGAGFDYCRCSHWNYCMELPVNLHLLDAGTIALPCHIDDITRFFRHTAWLFFLSWFALIFIKYHNTFPLFNSITFPSIKHRNCVLRLAASSFILEIKTTGIARAFDSCFSGHFGGLPSQTSRSRALPSCPPCGRGLRSIIIRRYQRDLYTIHIRVSRSLTPFIIACVLPTRMGSSTKSISASHLFARFRVTVITTCTITTLMAWICHA